MFRQILFVLWQMNPVSPLWRVFNLCPVIFVFIFFCTFHHSIQEYRTHYFSPMFNFSSWSCMHILHMKPLPCLFRSHPAFLLLLVDPKWDPFSPELSVLTFSWNLPYVPELKVHFYFLLCIYIQINHVAWCDLFVVFIYSYCIDSWKDQVHVCNKWGIRLRCFTLGSACQTSNLYS